MTRPLKSHKKSLAEKTLDAIERRRAKMTPAEIEKAEAATRKIMSEVRASRRAARGNRLTGADAPPEVHLS